MDQFDISQVDKLDPIMYQDVVNIFYEASSRKTFNSTEEKNDFQFRYLDFYHKKFANFFFVAHKKSKVLGYIAGASKTLGLIDLWDRLPHLTLFEDLYEKYPAHLHINLSQESRGMGVGSNLIKHLEQRLIQDHILGVHLITTPSARNVSFYMKNEYKYKVERLFEGHPLLFMGKNL